MQLKSFITAVALASGIGLAAPAGAQATAAAGSVIVVPVVAQTGSYATEVTVQNPNATPITVALNFYEATNSSTPGPQTCNFLTVPASSSVPFTLSGQCTSLTPAASHFGMLILTDAASQQTNTFFVYSRAQTPTGNGFSVEGFPIGAFSGADANVIGLKRQAAAPIYQSNCFVGALGEAIDYQLILRDGTTNAIIGNPLTGTLQPFEQIRFLDVFSQATAPVGDYYNVRANFHVTTADATPGQPAFVGLCTVQENTYFGADFRIAKSVDANSEASMRVACYAQDSCGQVSTTNPEQITGKTTRNIYSMIVTQPDFVACNLVAAPSDLANLQMQIRGPGDPFGTTVWPSTAPYDSGGAGKTSFYISTGPRNTVDLGVATRWFIDVEQTTGSPGGTVAYGITCKSGNGTEVPWFRGTATAF